MHEIPRNDNMKARYGKKFSETVSMVCGDLDRHPYAPLSRSRINHFELPVTFGPRNMWSRLIICRGCHESACATRMI
jgi:hypothetical protein